MKKETIQMKYLVASDIHGSAFYCKKMLEAYEREQADRLVLLGDILYHGPRNDLPLEYAPKTVISLLNEHKDKIIAVRGNCDAEVDQMVLDFPIMADYTVLQLVPGCMIYLTHGHIYHENHLMPMQAGDILLHGHTHVLRAEEKDGIVILNPGSISIPKEGNSPSYAVLSLNSEKDNKICFTIKTLDGEIIKEYTV